MTCARGGNERAQVWLAAALFVLSTIVLVGYSSRTGPAFDELGRLEAVERSSDIVRAVAADGIGALTSVTSQSIYASFDARGSIAVLLGAWAELSIGRIGMLDPLTSARLPWLMFAALGPALLFTLVVPSQGPLVAALAGLLLLTMPHFCHEAAVTSEAVTRSTAWLLVLALSQRALVSRGRATLAWSFSAAVALGLGSALTLGALWVLPLALAHYWAARRFSVRRLLSRGRVPLPAFVPIALLVVPGLILALTPALWTMNSVAAVRWLLAPLAPSVTPAAFGGRIVDALPVPLGFVPGWLLFTLPAATLLCLGAGLAVISHRALGRHFAYGRLRPRRDRTALGSLVLLGLAGSTLGPGCVPAPLAVFPPHAAQALPFAAIAAALGLDALARFAWPHRPLVPAAITLVALSWLPLFDPATSSASFDFLLGGTRAVARAELLPIGDGSELAALTPALDALARERVTMTARETPRELWRVLKQRRRLRTDVVLGENGELVLARGSDGGPALARVERGGAVLWTLRKVR